jgi:nucleotide-binding universal stress UspA family protein
VKRILHPSDFSSASRPAFKKAVEMAKTTGATLELVHVMTPILPVGGGYLSPQLYEDLAASQTASAGKELEKLEKAARTAGVKATSTVVVGTPADRIVRTARARRADLIVMGTHGRTGFSLLVLGSVAARVIAAAPSPVLTVRGK